MAEEQVGLGKEPVHEPAPWTKIFAGFRVAADPKKLLLAAAGIFVMAFGWWVLAAFFYTFYAKAPHWSDYEVQAGNEVAKREAAFKRYKQNLDNWNLMHRLAGPTTAESGRGVEYTVADFSHDLKQYEGAEAEYIAIENDLKRKNQLLKIEVDDAAETTVYFYLDSQKVHFKTGSVDASKIKADLKDKVKAEDLLKAYSPTTGEAKVQSYTLTLSKKDAGGKDEWERFEKYINTPRTLADIEYELAEGGRKDRAEWTRIALKVLRLKAEEHYKPSGTLATWPWFEYRGPNPFLVVTGEAGVLTAGKNAVPATTSEVILNWFYSQFPVLLEPLIKFLSPVVYFLHPAGGVWTKLYLLLVILWTILTWSLFGGAITRMAAVQVARPTERVGMVEAIRFAISRYRAFVASQLLPFAFLAGLTVLLLIYGFLEILIPGIGDIVIAGLGFPIVLILGLVMAVVLIGLTGWPLMYATISSEGSDSFDAISRSYSYVYQAPWQYVWYGILALLYGAVLVFFVGLMGSLLVYLGKFGMSMPSGILWESREPSYLYQYSPTSYGWRDLLLHGSQYVTTEPVVLNTGRVTQTYVFQKTYLQQLSFYNDWGARMVAFWLYLLFLMIIGFGYSYFWSASSIIYLLMRRKVDDTELDEVHLDEEEVDTHAFSPAAAPATPVATPGRTTVPLNVVEGPPTPPVGTQLMPQVATPAPMPPVRPADGEPPGHAPGTPSYSTDTTAPPASPKRTQLAPGGPLEGEEHHPDEPGHGTSGGQ